MNKNDLFSVREAANQLSLKPGTVRIYFLRGLLKKTKIGHATFVEKREIQRYLREKRPVGAQPK